MEGLDHLYAIGRGVVAFEAPKGLLVDLFFLGQDALLELDCPVGAGAKGLSLVVKAKSIGQYVRLAVFLVGEHVDRSISRAQLQYAGAFHLGIGFEGVQGVFHHGGATECPDHVLAVVFPKGDEHAHGSLRFPASMLYVISLCAVDVAFGVMGQRGVDGEYLGGELIRATSGGDQLSVGPSHVGHAINGTLDAGQADPGVVHFLQGKLADLPFSVDGQEEIAFVVLLADGKVSFSR